MSIGTFFANFITPQHSVIRAYDLTDFTKVYGELEIDAVLAEDVQINKLIPEFPIEGGESASDNSVLEPIDITLDCVTSERPVEYSDYIELAKELVSDEENIYLSETKEFLALCLQPDILVEVEIALGYFSSLSVKGIRLKKTPDDSGVLKFSLMLKEILVTTSKLVDLPEVQEYNPEAATLQKIGKGKGKGTTTNSNKGNKKAEDATTKTLKAKERSVFAQALKAFTEFLAKYFPG